MSGNVVGSRREGIVVFLDALGTRGSWLRSEPEQTIESMKKITIGLKSAYEVIGNREYLNEETHFTLDSFSDTMIFTAQGGSITGQILKCGYLVGEAIVFGLQHGIFFRGAMSHGFFYRDREEQSTFVIGPAVDEVAEWYDKANWLGVNAMPSANFIIEGMNPQLEPQVQVNPYMKFSVPFKERSYDMWCVDWISGAHLFRRLFDHDLQEHVFKGNLTEMVEYTIDRLRETEKWIYTQFSKVPTGLADFTKLYNTVSFYKHVRKEWESLQ